MAKEKLLGTSGVAHSNRITLVKKVRPHLGEPKEGDTIAFYLDDRGNIIIRKA